MEELRGERKWAKSTLDLCHGSVVLSCHVGPCSRDNDIIPRRCGSPVVVIP